MRTIETNRSKLNTLGDKLLTSYENSGDLKAAMLAIKSYAEVTKTCVAQVRYKQQAGRPDKIKFLED
jgi:hypothetical protein